MNGIKLALLGFVDGMSRPFKRAVFLALDATLAPFAFVLALVVLRAGFPPLSDFQRLWPVLPLLAAMSAIFATALGIPKIKLKSYESQAILITGAFAGLMAAWLFLLTQADRFSLPAIAVVLFGLFYFLASVAARAAMLRLLLWVLRSAQPRCRVLIYGAGTTGMQMAAALKSHDSIVPVAFLDDNPSLQSLTVAGLRVYSPDKIAQLMVNRSIDRVLMAMPSVAQPKQARIARKLQKLGIDVFTLPSFAQLAGTEALVDRMTPVVPGKFLGRKPVETLPEGAQAYAGKVILVTGAGGSIGSELCRQLLQYRPRRIVLFEVSEIALYTVHRELISATGISDTEILPVLGTVTDSRTVKAALSSHGVEVVIHAAAYKHVPLVEANPLAGMMNNVLGTRILAQAAEELGAERFILISTDKAVRPTNIMGASKRLAELAVQDLAKRSGRTVFTMVRFGNVLGSSGSVVPLFNDQIAQGGPVTVTHPEVTRFFMTISEAVQLVLLAGSFSQPTGSRGGDVFVLDMGQPKKIIDLARQMIEEAGYTVRDSGNPDGDIEIEITGLRPGEKLHEELLIGAGLLTTPHQKILRAQERSLTELDMAKMLQELSRAITAGDAAAARDVAESWVEGFAEAAAAARGDRAALALAKAPVAGS